MQGGLFEGKLLTSLYASAYFTNRSGKQQARHDYFDYNKYKVVRNNNSLTIYKYDIRRRESDEAVDCITKQEL